MIRTWAFVALFSAGWLMNANAQLLQQGSKLAGTGAGGNAQLGASVSLSADGNTAIVGGGMDNSGSGAAWVFTRSNGVWTQEGSKLTGTGAVDVASQGSSVSLSSDGNTAILGGYQDDSGAGAAWVFKRSCGKWTQEGTKLVGTGAVGVAQQGYSVALSSNGNTAIVGGYDDNSGEGAAWIFTRCGRVWSQEGTKLVGTGAVGAAEQGISVSLSSDGNTAVMGGGMDSSGAGAVWVFTRSGGVWSQQGTKLVGTGAVGAAYQGTSVSISSDGNTLIVGGHGDQGYAGAAWIFTQSGGVWSQQGTKLVGTGAVGAAFQGNSVALSSDGNMAIVGGYGDNGLAGAAWVFTRSGGVWTQEMTKLVGTGAVNAACQGFSVSLSSDGNTAIEGGPNDNGASGAAWVFSNSSKLPIQIASFKALAAPGCCIRLEWTTLSETNNFGFYVQRTRPADNTFADLPNGFKCGHGTTISPQSYSFSDSSAGLGTWFYRLKQVDLDGTIHFSESIQSAGKTSGQEIVPTAYEIAQNYPNPFNPSTTITVALPHDAMVSLEVYNALGQRVAQLVDGPMTAGYHSVVFDASQLASGLYLYRVKAGDYVAAKKMLVVR